MNPLPPRILASLKAEATRQLRYTNLMRVQPGFVLAMIEEIERRRNSSQETSPPRIPELLVSKDEIQAH